MAQWMIGESYFPQKLYADAIREYLRVEILYPYPAWQAAALLQAGKAHENQGQWQDALTMYARILRNYSQTSFVAEARTRLAEVQPKASATAGSRGARGER